MSARLFPPPKPGPLSGLVSVLTESLLFLVLVPTVVLLALFGFLRGPAKAQSPLEDERLSP